MLTRRAIMGSALAASMVRRANAANAGGVRVGAIRFDPWYSPDLYPGSNYWIAAHNLDSPKYQYRAPFCSSQVSPAMMAINCTQASMDAELVYASNAAIKWWAFAWYPTNTPPRLAWNYYQASANIGLVKWCVLISYNSLTQLFPPLSDLVSYMGQTTYESFGGRPLLVLMKDSSSVASCAAAIVNLRAACVTAGIGDPYIIIQSSTVSSLTADIVTLNADAISCYALNITGNGPIPFTSLDTQVQAFNASLIATTKPVVPLAMTGWDRRTRIERPPSFDLEWKPFGAMTNYVTPGTPAQQATHFAAVIAQVTANAAACPANRVLAYAWDEHDEGGGMLMPTWTSSGPNHATLDAISGVTQ